jgi:predicted MPP superfamily phosphohydrolase
VQLWRKEDSLKTWPVFSIFVIQTILLVAHWFLYHTWIEFWDAPTPIAVLALRIVLLLLAFSFVVAAMLSFKYSNPVVTAVYKLAAVWLGFLNYLFFAACLSWLAFYIWMATKISADPTAARPWIATAFTAIAVAAGVYGMLNARGIRTRTITVTLPGLPDSWRGRRAVLMSDLHLGHVNGVAFSRRLVAMASALRPDIVFIPGDLFDGTEVDLDHLVMPFKELNARFGTYFTTGNHEEFGGTAEKVHAIARAGIRVMQGEKITVDGLQIAGVSWGDSLSPMRLQAVLERMKFDPNEASILLNHMPSRLPLVERAGVSLQVSGHTHGGQVFPFTWMTRRVFGRFTYGLHRFGTLQVYTSTGAGTWGPPMRVGTNPEIVLIQFA